MSFLNNLFSKLPKITATVGIVIYVDGFLTGLTIKVLRFSIVFRDKLFKFRIPLYPFAYDRKLGLDLRESINDIRNMDKQDIRAIWNPTSKLDEKTKRKVVKKKASKKKVKKVKGKK